MLEQIENTIEALISVATIYLFIVIGFILKRVFKNDINERSFVLLNLYFLQPILIFWGLTRTPLDKEFITAPLVYFCAIFISLFIAFFYVLLFLQLFKLSVYHHINPQ